MGKVKPQRVRCQLVLDAKGKRLIRCKNPAKHRLPDGTPLCTVHWRMFAEGNRHGASAGSATTLGNVLDRRKHADQ